MTADMTLTTTGSQAGSLAGTTELTLADVTVSSRGTRLVDRVGLSLGAGVPLTVIGASGSGKSLLAHALMGTLPPDLEVSGRLEVDGTARDLSDRPGRCWWGTRFALLPQEPHLALDPTMRVHPQVAEGVARGRRRTPERAVAADQALASVGLAGVGRAWPHELSGGMAQRVAYAAATVGGAEVLIVDEPSKGLDAAAVDQLADLLLAHVRRGGLLLTITHDLRLARRLGGTVAVMRGAQVIDHGRAADLLDRPTHAYTRALVEADPSTWPAHAAEPIDASAPVLVHAEGISRRFGSKRLFDDLTLELRSGERCALVGPSGAGKTTLGRTLLGLTRPDSGEVRHHRLLDGGRIQKLYQDPVLSFPQRVPLRVGLQDVVRRHRLPAGRLPALLDAVGLDGSLLERRPGQVSGGELQRLALVRALLMDPLLLLADEATSRLDLLTQQQTVDCLRAELPDACALLLVTHDQALAAALTDRKVELGVPTPQL